LDNKDINCVICTLHFLKPAICYIPNSTPRIQFAAEELFVHRAGLSVTYTDNAAEYISSDAFYKFYYSNDSLPGISLFRSGFLDQTGIQDDFMPPCCRINGVFCLFPDETQQQFDLLAMIFWCFSRYEEYQPFEPDKHGRFPASASFLKKQEVLEVPVCDIAINAMFATWKLPFLQRFGITPTLDIDIAFAYAGRKALRTLGGTLRNPLSLSKRLKSIVNPEADPNNSFTYIKELVENHSKTRIFWHCGSITNRYDKQVELDYRPFREAVKNMDKTVQCGLHPSFAAFSDENVLQQEKQYLENTLNRAVTESRMHYLMLSMPRTYRSLLKTGITDEYSMGYPDAPGFRAGTSQPFFWYDLVAEHTTSLKIHPFCIMEATCKHYLQHSPAEAIQAGNKIKASLRETGGDFCFIFHNESLGSQAAWNGWNRVFEAWLA
jgi:hypothetical protein